MASKKVTDASFADDVLNTDETVLIDFWAEWCGPCKQIAPALEELSDAYAGKLVVAKVNLMFKGGELVATKVGAAPKSAIAAWIDEVLKEAAA
jgi:thioredoxin 1